MTDTASKNLHFHIDGVEIVADPGQSILEAADAAGIYIPRLCHKKGLRPAGACRLCTVLVNGKPCAACTQPVAESAIVVSDSEALREHRRSILELILVEGNHFCMSCEKSGNCELQALAYRLGVTSPRFPHLARERDVDASHPEVWIDRNRCILCGRCVRASSESDGKQVFGFSGRGTDKHVVVNSREGLGDTNLSANDSVVEACPVGALLRKGVGFAVPVGQRDFDALPIGADIDEKRGETPEERGSRD